MLALISPVLDIAASSNAGSPFSHLDVFLLWATVGVIALLGGAIAVRISQRRLLTHMAIPVTSMVATPASELELAAA